MGDELEGRPFTERIEDLRRRGYRYADLEAGSDRARSTAWFNKLINFGPDAVGPPAQDTFAGFAKLLNVTQRDVAVAVAEEWYGVKAADQSRRVRGLAARINALSKADSDLVEQLIQRLQPSAKSESWSEPPWPS
ncbi:MULTISPECIES: hypothetical protein [unclassified Pseudofrankia]|uniref:hypothetical protein n=1 Tax=unclassified Pseudofrankia TaxID=2994372 RepID=UPI001041CB3A|nr:MULTISPECIES: hypothetical protein [unclassified Pseudofrankia]MDT3443319.1 hypothetical protein [Pseudofrankia sp. BMG5.37]